MATLSIARPRRLWRVTWSVAFGLPLGAAIALCLLLRPSLGALVAPVLGPWAGLVFGHSECTIGNNAPVFSVALLAFGLATAAGAWLAAHPAGRGLLLLLAALSAFFWEAAALLSVVNTLS